MSVDSLPHWNPYSYIFKVSKHLMLSQWVGIWVWNVGIGECGMPAVTEQAEKFK